MKLEAVTLKLYRNFVDERRIVIEDDVTCLVGKNESGRTTILKALHRLKPATGEDTKFDLTTEYPRWRLAVDRRKDANLARTRPVTAEFLLDDAGCAALEGVYSAPIPDTAVCHDGPGTLTGRKTHAGTTTPLPAWGTLTYDASRSVVDQARWEVHLRSGSAYRRA